MIHSSHDGGVRLSCLKLAGQVGLVFVAYFVTGWLGLKLPYFGSHITLIWLPAGIATAAFVRWGNRMWPGIALAAWLVNWVTGAPLPVAFGIAVGNTLGPWLVAYWLRRVHFDISFARQVDVASFILASGAGMLISASGGVTSLYLAGAIASDGLGVAWLTWWVGDTVGTLLGGPVLLPVTRANLSRLGERKRGLALWFLVAGSIAWLVFVMNFGEIGLRLPIAFLTLPLFAWAALHFGVLAAAVACLGFAVVAAWSASMGTGAFHLGDAQLGLILLWSYIATTQLTGLSLSALKNERDHAEEILFKNEERMRLMTASVKDYSIIMLDPQGLVASWNEGSRRLKGYDAPEIIGKSIEVFYPAEDIQAGKPGKLLEQARTQGLAEDFGWRVRKDGSCFYADAIITALRAPSGELLGFSKVTRDITERKLAEEEQYRLNRALRLLSDSNLVLAQTHDEITLLNDLCRLVVDKGGYMMAWVGFAEHDAEKTVRPVAQSDAQEGYLNRIRVSWDADREIGHGSTGTAIRTGHTAVNQNLLTNPKMAVWREAILARSHSGARPSIEYRTAPDLRAAHHRGAHHLLVRAGRFRRRGSQVAGRTGPERFIRDFDAAQPEGAR